MICSTCGKPINDEWFYYSRSGERSHLVCLPKGDSVPDAGTLPDRHSSSEPKCSSGVSGHYGPFVDKNQDGDYRCLECGSVWCNVCNSWWVAESGHAMTHRSSGPDHEWRGVDAAKQDAESVPDVVADKPDNSRPVKCACGGLTVYNERKPWPITTEDGTVHRISGFCFHPKEARIIKVCPFGSGRHDWKQGSHDQMWHCTKCNADLPNPPSATEAGDVDWRDLARRLAVTLEFNVNPKPPRVRDLLQEAWNALSSDVTGDVGAAPGDPQGQALTAPSEPDTSGTSGSGHGSPEVASDYPGTEPEQFECEWCGVRVAADDPKRITEGTYSGGHLRALPPDQVVKVGYPEEPCGPLRPVTATPSAGTEPAHAFLGQQVRVLIGTAGPNGRTVVKGKLLSFSNGGEFTVQDEDGFVHYCWPLLDIEAATPSNGDADG